MLTTSAIISFKGVLKMLIHSLFRVVGEEMFIPQKKDDLEVTGKRSLTL